MINKLQSGDILRKDWLNSVAERSSAEIPSTGNFTNTTNGALFDPSTSNTVTNYRPFVETMFQCSYGGSFEISARSDTEVDEFDTSSTKLTFKMRLGPTVSDIKNNVKYEKTLNDVFILNNDSSDMTICLNDTKLISSYNMNSYIDLAAYDKTDIELKVIKVELTSQSQQSQRPPLYVLGIGPSGKDSYNEILQRDAYSQYEKTSVVRSHPIAKIDENKKLHQLDIGFVDMRDAKDIKIPDGDSDVNWESEELSAVEPRLSSIHQNEISGTSYYQLYNFDKDTTTDKDKLSAYNPAVLVRKIDGKDHTLEYVALSALSGTSCSADSEIESLNLSSIAVANTEGDGKAYQLYNFDKDTTIGKDELSAYKPAVLVRKINGNDHTLEYVALSDVSSGEGTPCSADSEIQSLNLSSIGIVDNGHGKVYELYNFDKMNTDVNSRIMTLGGLTSDRHGKVGKLVDANGNVLTAVDIVVSDKDTHEIKYMNLSVDETYVDSYIGGEGGTNSIIYDKTWYKSCYLKLYNFENYNANDYLVCNLSSNGKAVFGKDGDQDATYVLCKNYDTNNKRWTLEYKKLQISCDLSGGGSASISGDTNVITTRKSIDTKTASGKTFHQLHNFDNPAPTTKTVDMLAKNTAYDTLDSNEYFVIKSGDEVKYKKVQIKDNTPGGVTEGLTTDLSVVLSSTYSEEYHTFTNKMKKLSFANGLLTAAIDLPDQTVFTAVEHIAHT